MSDAQFEELIGVLSGISEKLDRVIELQAQAYQGVTLSAIHTKLDDVVNAISDRLR